MAKKIIRGLMIIIFVVSANSFFMKNIAYAQTNEEKVEMTGTRKQLATIIFSGLAGAILGLSTLSFYGRPQEHLSNIAVGFAFGVIGGTIYTTYKAATRPYDAYDLEASNLEHKRLSGMDVYAMSSREIQPAGRAHTAQLFRFEF